MMFLLIQHIEIDTVRIGGDDCVIAGRSFGFPVLNNDASLLYTLRSISVSLSWRFLTSGAESGLHLF